MEEEIPEDGDRATTRESQSAQRLTIKVAGCQSNCLAAEDWETVCTTTDVFLRIDARGRRRNVGPLPEGDLHPRYGAPRTRPGDCCSCRVATPGCIDIFTLTPVGALRVAESETTSVVLTSTLLSFECQVADKRSESMRARMPNRNILFGTRSVHI